MLDDFFHSPYDASHGVIIQFVGCVAGRMIMRIAERRGVGDHDARVAVLPERPLVGPTNSRNHRGQGRALGWDLGLPAKFADCCAHERAGGAQFVSWDEWMAEVPSRLSISAKEAESWPAERIFDVRWAATAAEHALRQLGEECEARGRRRVFDVLSDCLAAERQDVSYQKLSKTLGIPKRR